MKHSIKSGLGFGVTSGIITTLGLIMGLASGTQSKAVVVAGIVTVAVADSLSDSLGIHVSEESKNNRKKYTWTSAISATLSKFSVAMSFLIPLLLLDFFWAIVASILWGALMLGVFSYYMALENDDTPWKVVGEHLLIAAVVVIITYYAGQLVNLLV